MCTSTKYPFFFGALQSYSQAGGMLANEAGGYMDSASNGGWSQTGGEFSAVADAHDVIQSKLEKCSFLALLSVEQTDNKGNHLRFSRGSQQQVFTKRVTKSQSYAT
jgi:hypothetical protein